MCFGRKWLSNGKLAHPLPVNLGGSERTIPIVPPDSLGKCTSGIVRSIHD
jgi:hypothetical protein